MSQSFLKICNACKVSKSCNAFSPNKRAKDGLQGKCRLCCSESKKSAYYANLEESRKKSNDQYYKNKNSVSKSQAAYRAKNSEIIKKQKKEYYEKIKLSKEYQNKIKNYTDSNKDRKKLYDEQYRKNNAEKLNAIHKEWQNRNPDKVKSIKKTYKAKRRSQEKRGDSTAKIHEWEISAKKVCYWCFNECDIKYHIDHYQPLSKGGLHEVNNLVISCPSCNLKKNAKDPYLFASSLGRLF